MTMRTEWPSTGQVREFSGMTQREINRLINLLQQIRDSYNCITQVKITVTED